MKRPVGNAAYAPCGKPANHPRADGVRRAGGRLRLPRDLYDWMFPLAGLLYLADLLSLVQLPVVVEYLLAGIMFGSFTGKSIVVWRERGGFALDPDRVRQIEHLWVLIGVAVMVFAILAQVAVALARGGFA
jgi:Kef-type K+ transport system membrane component KefB